MSEGHPADGLGEWRRMPPPPLRNGVVHVWRIRIDRVTTPADWAVLSPEEDGRARRFFAERHQRRYVVAHASLRRILSAYAGMAADELAFRTGRYGKPELVGAPSATPVEFNLSHSGDLALVAVARDAPVGIDVERWDDRVEHIDLATRFFSPVERDALQRLAPSHADVQEGFFSAWSRKEAYLKASGHGIARGLHHFDVSLTPGQPARILRDRLDAGAPSRWTMTALAAHEGYSAALVAAKPVDEILLFDAT